MAAVLLLPIDVTKLWSDQLTGVTDANFLPNQTGGQERQYMLMGAAQSYNFDGKGHLKAKVSVPGPAELRNKILWRLAKKNGSNYEPENGTSTYNANGDEVTITVDSPRADDAASSYLVAGYDTDGNGQLSSSEACVVPKYKWQHHDANGNVVNEDHEYEVKIISTATYNGSKQSVTGLAGNWNTLGLTDAYRLLNAFLTESTPAGASAQPTTIACNDFRLTHADGILFVAPGNPGNSINAVYGPNSQLSSDVMESTGFNNWLSDRFDEKRTEVDQRFRLSDNVEETFIWQFTTSVGFSKYENPDLFLAIAGNQTNVTVEVVVNRFEYTVESVTINGSITDLYDFDYDGGILTSILPDYVRHAARIQAGYNTLGTAGRVYTDEVQLQSSSYPIQFRFQ